MKSNNNRRGRREKSSSQGSKSGKEQWKDRERSSNNHNDRPYDCYKSKPNDWRWYAQNEQMLRDTASFPYTWPLGHILNMGSQVQYVNWESIPGIMTIDVSPSFGWSDSENSPINIAARNIYSFVRDANSGHTNYEAPDLMLYLAAMDSAYSFLAWCKRVYGVAMTYSYTNRYYAKSMVNAMGVDYEDLVANLADFRAFINTYAVKVGSLVVPASMAYTAKHVWMYSGYYIDSQSDKAQTVMFNPYGFFVFGFDSDSAGQLVYSKAPWAITPSSESAVLSTLSVLTKCSDIYTYGYSILDPILADQDFAIMGGDILKAFGSSGVYMVEQIPENYVVMPSYDMEVMDQIQNSTLLGYYVESSQYGFSTNAPILKQSANKTYLEFTPGFRYAFAVALDAVPPGLSALMSNRFINFQHGDVTPANTMEASRMTNIVTSYQSQDSTYNNILMVSTTIGSEVAHGAHMYYFRKTNGVIVNLYVSRTIFYAMPLTMNIDMRLPAATIANNAKSAMSTHFAAIQKFSQFDRHPIIMLCGGAGAISSTGAQTYNYADSNGYFGDLDYYTIVTSNDLEQMTQTALLSMFNVTQYGRAPQ